MQSSVKRTVSGLTVTAGLAALLAAGPAPAHVAPSPTENNRYLKVTLLPDAVRLAYTVYFGERPGAAERLRMDRDRNGLIDDRERDAFGAALLAEIAPHLVVEVDGGRTGATWAVADVGLGTPATSAGAFALDLLLVAPLPDPTAVQHTLWLEDRWPVPLPGETEVNVHESPGVRAVESHVQRDGRGVQLRFTFRGMDQRPEERGILVKFAVDPEVAAQQRKPPPAASAPAPTPAPPRRSRRSLVIVAVVLGAAAAAAVVVRLRRR